MTNCIVGKVASCDGATLKATELFGMAIPLPIFVFGDCMAVCWILIHLSATGVAEMAESTNSKGCMVAHHGPVEDPWVINYPGKHFMLYTRDCLRAFGWPNYRSSKYSRISELKLKTGSHGSLYYPDLTSENKISVQKITHTVDNLSLCKLLKENSEKQH